MTGASGFTPPRLAAVRALQPAAYTVFRAGAGLLFLQHGLQKVFGLLGGIGPTGGGVPLVSQFGLAGGLELVGGILIAAGVLTRPVALVLLLEMLVAFFQVHFPRGGWPLQNGGELALLYGSIWVFLAAFGAGPWSVDAAMKGR